MKKYTQDILKGQFNTIKKSEYTKKIQQNPNDKKLERKLPQYSQQSVKKNKSKIGNSINRRITLNNILHASAYANKTQIQGHNFISRTVKLNPKIKVEGYQSQGNARPQTYWENKLPTLNKLKLNAKYSS